MSFYVILPSNTAVDGNRTNSFRVRLPRKLEFRSEWSVGLAVFAYPRSWPSLGASGEQEFIRIQWKTLVNKRQTLFKLPITRLNKPENLISIINAVMRQHCDNMIGKISSLLTHLRKHFDSMREKILALWEENHIRKAREVNGPDMEVFSASPAKTDNPEEVNENLKKERESFILNAYQQTFSLEYFSEQELELLRSVAENPDILGTPDDALKVQNFYRDKMLKCFRIDFIDEIQRFSLTVDDALIEKIELSERLSFIMGFPDRKYSFPGESTHVENLLSWNAKFIPDLSGGISALYVYAPGLIEPVIVGNCSAPLLRVAIVRGKPDDFIEDAYVPVQYHRLLAKELSDVQIEICDPNGHPMPFQYGSCILTLHFKKNPYF